MATHIYHLSRKSICSLKSGKEELKQTFKGKVSPKIQKYLLSSIMCFTMFTYGIICTTLSPTLVDLKYVFNVSLKRVSIYYTLNSFGYICGSLYGFIFKYINRQITLAFLIGLMGISYCFIPQSSSIYIYYTIAFLIGMSGGAWEVGQFVWFIEMWKDKSGAMLQLSQFMFGVGAIVGPLIDKPFVTGEIPIQQDLVSPNMTSPNVHRELNRKSMLLIPFAIAGSMHLLGALFMFVMFSIKKYKVDSNNEDNGTNTRADETRSSSKDKLVIILGAICLSTYSACESGFFQFSPTFSQFLPLRLSGPDAAAVFSTMTFSFSIARGLGFFVALKFKPQIILVANYFILSVGYLILLFADSSKTILLIANVILGIGYASFWPSFFAFLSQFINVSDRVGTAMIFAVGGTLAIIPIIMGSIIETNPVVLVYFSFFTLFISCTTFIIIFIIMRKDLKDPNQFSDNLQRLSITSTKAAANDFKIRKLSTKTCNYYYDSTSAERFEKF